MIRPRTLGLLLAALAISAAARHAVAQDAFEPNWESLAKHDEAPQWFQDAKLGIYFHWGVYSVPAFGSEWYPRDMHLKDHREYKHHVATYGDPVEYGYDKFVEQFKAEKFNADDWAALFRQAGARFAGPVAEHHDGFAMWASKVTPWNALDRGPRRDVTGELAQAIRKQGMRLITTFHHCRNNLWEKEGRWTGHYDGVKANFPKALEDPERAFLYGAMPRDKFLEMWFAKLREVIDNYQPDIVWFDSWLDEVPEELRQEFCAYYLNAAKKQGKEVVIVRKQDDLPLEVSVLDHEKARTSGMSDRVWMTDDTISTGSWCYTRDLRVKSTAQVLHSLIDTVAKNGVVLLNISPKADGEIPADQQQVLVQLGAWLGKYGEAIYETRPWLTYGEGPTKEPRGGFRDAGGFLRLKYSAADVRYTRSKDNKTVYALLLGAPEAGQPVTLRSFGDGEPGAGVDVADVALLGVAG
ncbi:MAG TPA: alpha-L-fucosidase [Lacipirellulaceae bacterium]|nr:alpha-L-fucosidase [Lacipirellulaceae bacterium]